MVNCIEEFILGRAILTGILDKILRVNCNFKWGPELAETFAAIKAAITHVNFVAAFDQVEWTLFETDAS